MEIQHALTLCVRERERREERREEEKGREKERTEEKSREKRQGVKREEERAEEKRFIKENLNAEFQRIAWRDKKAFLSDQSKEIEENNRMGKLRSLQEN